jgi:hypothetical protein
VDQLKTREAVKRGPRGGTRIREKLDDPALHFAR